MAAAERNRQETGSELGAALSGSRRLFLYVGVFSFFVNLLMLTGPLFMLQVYDRVLSSRSEATLVALFALVTVLYLIMGFLDYARGRVMARVGAAFQSTLDRRVFEAVLRRAV
ncbi:MAG: ABC transporter transmembrane domain-containing protein, partial [Pseudomonadota bacterium]